MNMKKLYLSVFAFACLTISPCHIKAQCTNADFSEGTFGSWTGTWGDGDCDYNSPTENVGFVLGPVNDPPSDANNQYHQVICSAAGGNDPNLTGLGFSLPMVWPGAQYSGRIGNMWQDVAGGDGNGETITYALTVTPTNSVFIYHYAVVLYDGGHPPGQEPFFNISVTDGNGNDIACGDYEIDAHTAHTIGGFTNAGREVYFKPWSSVLLPLVNYIGQTVKITFTTRGCDPNGCAGSHYAYAYIDAQCGPPTVIASSPTICGQTGITLTAPAGAATYSWATVPAGGSGIVSGGSSQVVTVNQPGRYIVTMTTFGNNPCTYSIDTIIPGNPQGPTANFSTTPTCIGSPTQFTDLSTPLITGWAWDFTSSGTTQSGIQNPAYTYPAAGTYPVKLSIVSGSCSADTTLNVVVLPAPNSPFTVTGPVCANVNSTITYTGTAPGGSTYAWNFAGGTVASGSGVGPYQVNWANGGTQNVTLVVTSGTCPSPLTTEPVVVNAYPVLTITPDTGLCIGSSITLNATGATTYTWMPTAALTGANNTASVIATPASTTTYSVTGTTNNCSSTANTIVTVYPIPTSAFSVVTPVCVSQNSQLTYTGNSPSTATYAWNFNGGTASPGGTVQGPQQVYWSTSGTQTVSLQVSQFGCTSPITTNTIVVNPNPTSSFTAESPVCLGFPSTIVYTGDGAPTASYIWNFVNGTIATTPGSDSISCVWNTAGTKYLTLQVTQAGCPSPVTTVPVVVHPIPTANFTVTSPLCSNAGGTITYIGTSSIAASFAWTYAGGHLVSGNGKGPLNVSWTNSLTVPITEHVMLTVTDSGCVSPPDTLPVTINPIPISNAGNDVAYCSGSSAPLGTTSLPGYAYSWSPTAGLNNPNVSNPTVSLTNDSSNIILKQPYQVITTSLNCTSSDNAVVTVNPIPIALFTPPNSRCLKNNDLAFTALGSYLNSANFLWNFGPGAIPDSSVFPNQTVIYGSPGAKGVSLTIIQTSTNCSNTFTDTVNIYPEPFVSFKADTLRGCENFDVCFNNYSVSPGSSSYLWEFGDGEATNDSAPCHIYNFPGVYTVYLKITSDEGCEHDTTMPNLITVIADPVAKFLPSASIIQQPQSEIDFTNLSYNAVRYNWSFSTVGVNDDTIGSSTNFNTQFNFIQYGLYNILLTAYNSLNCQDTSLQSVIVTPPQNIFVPNVFTPNGDGKNDLVYPYSQEGVTILSFRIFDRSGEKVHDGLYPWDGTFKGKPCMPAVYVYEAEFKQVDGAENIYKKGSITLVR
jgi:gliding motility-associated-like protein